MDSDELDPTAVGDEISGQLANASGAKRPSVWPAFVVVGGAIGIAIVAQIAVAVALTVGHMAEGGEPDPEAIQEATQGFFLSPVGFVLMAALGQLAFIGCVLLAISLLPGDRVEQLGLARPRLPASSYLAFVAGTGVPVAIGVGFSWLLSLAVEPMFDPTLIWQRISPWTFVPYVLFIALAPGFIEEITFRGFAQRRLMLRWSPRAAIAWSSVLFAIAHVDPHNAVFALPLGVWLGVIAWRIGSTWPGIACHAALNGLWSIYFIATLKSGASTGFYVASALVVVTISVVGFVASLRTLARVER